MTPDPLTLGPLADQDAGRTLRHFEDEYLAADRTWTRDRTPEAWERANDLARVCAGIAKAHNLIPSVDLGSWMP